MTKAELIARIAPAREALDATVAALTEDELADYRDGAGWSTVDHLSHIAAWERMLVAHLTDGTDHEIAGLSRERYVSMGLDDVNNLLYHRVRGMALGEAMAEYEAAHAAVVSEIESMDEAAFAKPYWGDDPEQRTVMEKLVGDTYKHYLEHRRWIMELMESQTGVRDG